jgi:hypothetical protein
MFIIEWDRSNRNKYWNPFSMQKAYLFPRPYGIPVIENKATSKKILFLT